MVLMYRQCLENTISEDVADCHVLVHGSFNLEFHNWQLLLTAKEYKTSMLPVLLYSIL